MPIAELPALLANIGALSQVTIPKAAAICVDDVAVNTKLLTGLERGHKGHSILKVVRGSLLNKIILIPAGLALSAIAPWAVLPLLAVGGLHLANEGMEKLRGKGHDHDDPAAETADPEIAEKKKIKSALKVDFILSAEVTILTLAAVVGAPLLTQLAVLAVTGLAVTAGLYGLIGGIIKLDDAGRWLSRREGTGPAAKAVRAFGSSIEKSVSHLMKGISIAGTIALFMIGGELMLQGIPGAEQLMAGALGSVTSHGLGLGILSLAAEISVGLAAGLAAIPVKAALGPSLSKILGLGKKMLGKVKKEKPPANDNAPMPQVTPAPNAEASAKALQQAPDVKAALNAAAPKPPAAQLPEQRSPTPPKIKPAG